MHQETREDGVLMVGKRSKKANPERERKCFTLEIKSRASRAAGQTVYAGVAFRW